MSLENALAENTAAIQKLTEILYRLVDDAHNQVVSAEATTGPRDELSSDSPSCVTEQTPAPAPAPAPEAKAKPKAKPAAKKPATKAAPEPTPVPPPSPEPTLAQALTAADIAALRARIGQKARTFFSRRSRQESVDFLARFGATNLANVPDEKLVEMNVALDALMGVK